MPFLRDIFTQLPQVAFIRALGFDLDTNYVTALEMQLLIYKAARHNQRKILERLNEAKIDLCIPPSLEANHTGYNPLITALGFYSSDAAAFLIEKKIGLEQADNETGEFPFMTAIRKGDMENMLRLIQMGANINQENLTSPRVTSKNLPYRYMNPLMYAASGVSLEPINLLISHGAATVNSQGVSALEYCYNDDIKKIVEDEIQKKSVKIIKRIYETLTPNFLPRPITQLICSYKRGYAYMDKNYFFNSRKRGIVQENLSHFSNGLEPLPKILRTSVG